MNNINTDKLYNFISHASILFLLFIIVYLMYIDYIREKMSNKKIYQSSLQEKFNNLLSNNGEEIIFDKNDPTGLTLQNMKLKKIDVIENFQPINPELKYIIKRNYNNINNAKCISGDNKNENSNICYMAINTFYPTQSYLSTAIKIKSLSDSVFDKNKNKNTFFAIVEDNEGNEVPYNDYIIQDENKQDVINLGYKSNYFSISNSKINRKLDYTNPLESKIIQYFLRCEIYKLYVNNNISSDIDIINNMLITDEIKYNMLSEEKRTDINIRKQNIINSIQNLLLLKSGFGLELDIHNIKKLLIRYYEKYFKENIYPDSDLTITDDSVLILLIDPKTKTDDVNNLTIYSMIFKIDINIKLTNLAPELKDNTLDPKLLTSLSSLKSLIYAKNTNNIYSYKNTISFPIALPFNLPELTVINPTGAAAGSSTNAVVSGSSTGAASDASASFIEVNVSNNKWYDDIKTYISTLFIDNQLQKRVKTSSSGVDSVTSIMDSINTTIKNDINILSTITNIFAYYEPSNNINTSISGTFYFIITLNKSENKKPIWVMSLKNNYDPQFCEDPNATLYNKKCLPGCPTGYDIDLGLVCIKSDISNFIPNSDFCVQLNALKPTEIKNTILQGLIDACNPDNINNVSNESLFNIDEMNGIKKINKNNYILDNEFNDPSLLSRSRNDDDDNSIDSTFSTSFNNVDTKTVQHFDNVNTKTVQHFDNINISHLQSMSTRKDKIRYDIKSREETRPEINKQTGKKIEHFSPFLN